jgi:MFS family permease
MLFIILFVAALSFWTSITCLVPILPTYIQDLGGSNQQVGFVMGSFAIGLLASRIWLGKLADQRSRKLVILIGTLVSGIAPLGYLYFNTVNNLMFVRAFHGISIAAFTTAYSALVVDLSPPKQKGELIGYMSLAVPVGMAIGPALGGFLQFLEGYRLLFIVSSSFGFLALILSTQVRENKPLFAKNQSHELSQDDSPASRSLKELLSSPSLVVPTILLLLVGCLFGTVVTFLPLYVRHLQIDFNTGFFFTAAAISSFILRFVSGKASDRYGRGLFISLSLLCYFIAMILLTIGHSGNVFVIAGILEGMGSGIMIPITLALVSDRCTTQERAKVFAFCTSGFDLGIALVGPIFGSLNIDYTYLFAMAAVLSVIGMLVFITFSNKNLAYSWRFALGNAPDYYALEIISRE